MYELKYDGFCALAHLTGCNVQLISRCGNPFKGFAALRESLRSLQCDAVLDGEIVVLDATGRPQFYEVLRRRGEPVCYAFDCLMHEGRDLRASPLTKRKAIIKRIVRDHPRILVARHFDRDGSALFRLVCENDLERIVAKRGNGAYGADWFKIRNPNYSQYERRRELFDKRASYAALPPVRFLAAGAAFAALAALIPICAAPTPRSPFFRRRRFCVLPWQRGVTTGGADVGTVSAFLFQQPCSSKCRTNLTRRSSAAIRAASRSRQRAEKAAESRLSSKLRSTRAAVYLDIAAR